MRGTRAAVTVRWHATADNAPAVIHACEDPVLGIVPSEGSKATRVGLNLAEPVREATLTIIITP